MLGGKPMMPNPVPNIIQPNLEENTNIITSMKALMTLLMKL